MSAMIAAHSEEADFAEVVCELEQEVVTLKIKVKMCRDGYDCSGEDQLREGAKGE